MSAGEDHSVGEGGEPPHFVAPETPNAVPSDWGPQQQGPYGAEWMQQGSPYGYQQYGAYPYGGYIPSQTDRGARNAMFGAIFAIVCVLFCWILAIIFGPAAIVEGERARRRIRHSYGSLTGTAMAISAMVLGTIATVLAVLTLVLLTSLGGNVGRSR